MFENRNTRICLKLAIREIRFHKTRSLLTILVAVLTATLFSFVLFLGSSMRLALETELHTTESMFSDIVFTDLTRGQAEQLRTQGNVKTEIWYQSIGTVAAQDSRLALAAYNEDYAMTASQAPTLGRLPETADEIAMDVSATYLLGGTGQVGSPITLSWTPDGAQKPVEQTFTLVGTWEPTSASGLAWVSDELAAAYPTSPNSRTVTAGVTLWRPGDIARSAGELAAAIGVTDPDTYTTTGIYEDYQAAFIWHYIRPVLANEAVVFLCGFFMFFAIFQMSAELDVRFYGRMKTIGMTPFQMRRVVYYWASLLVVASVPFGWLFGFWINEATFQSIMAYSTPTAYRPLDFIISLLAVWLAVVLASLLPALRVSRMTPVEAVNLSTPQKRQGSHAKQEPPHRTTLFHMALQGTFRQKGRLAFSVAALVGAAMFSCTAFVQYKSFDKDIGTRVAVSFDYLVSGAMQQLAGAYQPDDATLAPALYEDLKQAVGAQNISRVYRTTVTDLPLDDALYERITAYFDEEHRDYFTDNYLYPGFAEGYQQLVDTHRIPVVVYGVEDLVMQQAADPLFHLNGTYDRAAFEAGGNAFVCGIHVNQNFPITDYQPLPEVGSSLSLLGRSFTVMGNCVKPNNIYLNFPESPLTLGVWISADEFKEIFPDANLFELLFNPPAGDGGQAAQILADYENSTGYTLGILQKQTAADGFQQFISQQSTPKFILAVTLFLVALVGFLNLLFHRTLARSREFAVYRSLGMSRRELLKLLLLENGIYVGLIALILYPLSAVAAGPIMQYYYATGPEWAYSYHFTLLPTHLLLALLVVLAALLPVLCIHITERDSITHRLNLE